MKRTLLFSLFALLLSITSFAQGNTIKPDARLQEIYSAEYLKSLQTNNPFLIQRWNYYLDNSYFITDIPEGKEMDYPTVELDENQEINILKIEKEQNLSRDFKMRMYYQIKGTNRVLVFYSGERFKNKLNKHLGRS